MKFPKRFFRRIFGNILEDHALDVEFRCLHPAMDKESLRPRQFWFHSVKEMEDAWPEVEELNRQGYDIHFTVVPRLRKSQGKKEHPLPDEPITACVWADLDVGEDKPYKNIEEAQKRIDVLKVTPSMIVHSGTGLHPYISLKEPISRSKDRLEGVLHSLTNLLDGDKGAGRASRLMRVPNTINWKTGRPGKLATAQYLPKIRYRLKDLEAAWNSKESERKGADQNKEKKQSKTGPGKYWEVFDEHVAKLVLIGNSSEASGLCPFHDDEHPSFSVNTKTGLWKCHASGCNAEGNAVQFCTRLNIPVPATAIKRFPRLRVIPREDELTSEEVFQEVYDYITRQIRFAHSWQPVVVTLWAMGTYVYMQFPCYGHLWLNSPTTHSGKTKTEDVMSTICYKATEPQLAPTAAVVFRFPTSIGGTLILDEIDRLSPDNQSDVIAVLNHYKSTGGVLRNVPSKDKQYTLAEFKVYCPKIIAGINNLPEVTQDRCLKIYLHRKNKDEKVERFMPGAREEREPLRNQLEAWAVRNGFRLLGAYHRQDQLGVPAEADDRLRDIIEPLFAIAVALPKWVNEKLVEATERLARNRRANEAESDPVVLGVQILNDHFPKNRDDWRLRSDLALEFLEEIPGIETVANAQALLRKLGFRSQSVRVGDKVLRAYVIPKRRLDRLVSRYGGQDAA